MISFEAKTSKRECHFIFNFGDELIIIDENEAGILMSDKVKIYQYYITAALNIMNICILFFVLT